MLSLMKKPVIWSPSLFVVLLYIMLNLSKTYVCKTCRLKINIIYIDENAFDFLMNTFNQQLFKEKILLDILGHVLFEPSFFPHYYGIREVLFKDEIHYNNIVILAPPRTRLPYLGSISYTSFYRGRHDIIIMHSTFATPQDLNPSG